jgi:phenolic acid decarboxylase
MDMRLYWIKHRIEQDQYRVYWEPRGENLADYFTKQHASAHHQIMRSRYVHNTRAPMICNNADATQKHTARVY